MSVLVPAWLDATERLSSSLSLARASTYRRVYMMHRATHARSPRTLLPSNITRTNITNITLTPPLYFPPPPNRYFFLLFFLITLIGALNGLFLLPILLTLVGPPSLGMAHLPTIMESFECCCAKQGAARGARSVPTALLTSAEEEAAAASSGVELAAVSAGGPTSTV